VEDCGSKADICAASGSCSFKSCSVLQKLQDRPSGLNEAEIANIKETETQNVMDFFEQKGTRNPVVNVDVTKTETGTLSLDLHIGKSNGAGYTTKQAAEAAAKRKGWSTEVTPQFVQSTDDQWFIKVSNPIENADWINTYDLEQFGGKHAFSKFLLSSAATQDEYGKGLALLTQGTQSKIFAQDFKNFKTIASLGRFERKKLNAVMLEGMQKEKWYTQGELKTQFGLNDVQLRAYEELRIISKIDYAVRDASARFKLEQQGFKSAKFTSPANEKLDLFVKEVSLPDDNNFRIYSLADNTNITKGELGKAKLSKLQEQGYKLYKTRKSFKSPMSSDPMSYILAKPDQLKLSNIKPGILGTTQGGHRAYTEKYWAKQTVTGSFSDTGERFLDDPHVFINGSLEEVDTWVKQMEESRLTYNDWKSGKITKAAANRILEKSWVKDVDNFDNLVQKGELRADTPIERVYDGEVPNHSIQLKNAVDLRSTTDSQTLYYSSSRKGFESKRGLHVAGAQDELAPIMNPIDVANRALINILDTGSWLPYRYTQMQRWVDTATKAGLIDTSKLPANASIEEIFYSGVLDEKASGSLRIAINKLETQRAVLKNAFNGTTEGGRRLRNAMRRTAEDLITDQGGKVKKVAGKVLLSLSDKNPTNVLRAAAFDLKLGMFNPLQIPLQLSSLVGSSALSGKHGWTSFKSSVPMRIYTRNGTDEVLDVLAKKFAKDSGLTESEFKDMAKSLKRSGYSIVAHTPIDSTHYDNILLENAISGGIKQFREAGRVFFNAAEEHIRTTTFGIAYREALEKYGSKAFSESDDILGEILARADNLGFNMTQQTTHYWRKGAFSVPTQFLSYFWNTWETLLGAGTKSKVFTTKARKRLALTLTGLYGANAIPFGNYIVDKMSNQYTEATGNPANEYFMKFVRNGFLDGMLYASSSGEVDTNISGRLSPSNNIEDLVKSVFDPENGKSIAALAIGPSGNIVGDTISDITYAIGRSLYGVFNDPKHYVNYAPSELKHMLDTALEQAATLSYIERASTAIAASEFVNAKGQKVTDVNFPEALVYTLTGGGPQKAADAYKLSLDTKEWQGATKEGDIVKVLKRFSPAADGYVKALAEGDDKQARMYELELNFIKMLHSEQLMNHVWDRYYNQGSYNSYFERALQKNIETKGYTGVNQEIIKRNK